MRSKLLDTFLHPVTTARFSQEFWGQEILHLSQQGASARQGLLPVKHVLQAVARASSSQRVLILGEEVGAAYDESVRAKSKPLTVAAINQALLEGNSLMVNLAEHHSQKIAALFTALQSFVQLPAVDCALFITPPSQQTLPRHTDDEHTFTLQIAGTKKWRFFRPADVTNDNARAARTVELKAGHALYVPRGISHEVSAGKELSISLGIGFRGLTGQAVLAEWFEATLRQMPEAVLQQEMPCAFLADASRKSSVSIIAELAQHFATVSEHAGPDTWDHAKGAMIASLRDPSQEVRIADAETWTLRSVLKRRANVEAFVSRESSTSVLSYSGGGRLVFPAELHPILEQICQTRGKLSISAIPHQGRKATLLALLRQLCRIGIIEFAG